MLGLEWIDLKSLLYAVYVVQVFDILGRGVLPFSPSGWNCAPPPLPSWKSVIAVKLTNKFGSIEPLNVPGRCKVVTPVGIFAMIFAFNFL